MTLVHSTNTRMDPDVRDRIEELLLETRIAQGRKAAWLAQMVISLGDPFTTDGALWRAAEALFLQTNPFRRGEHLIEQPHGVICHYVTLANAACHAYQSGLDGSISAKQMSQPCADMDNFKRASLAMVEASRRRAALKVVMPDGEYPSAS
jgi:hypothetical protein